MKNVMISFLAITALLLIPACDSGGSGGSGDSGNNNDGGTTNDGGTNGNPTSGFVTGLDQGLALADLTDDQQIAACEAGDAYVAANADHDDMQKATCAFSGMFASMMQMTCQEAVDACMAEPHEMEPSTCANDVQDLSDCTDITVGEVEACIDAEMTVVMEQMATLAGYTCAELEADGEAIMASLEDESTPAACDGLEAKCPVFFEDGDDDAGDMNM